MHPTSEIRACYAPRFRVSARMTAIFFALTTSLISFTLKQTNIPNDRRFLQTDSEENPEVRIYTKGVSPHLPVLLCVHAVRVRSDGSDARSFADEPG